MKVYRDKIYKQLVKDDVSDNILREKINQEDCTYSDVYKFLLLLNRLNILYINTKEYQLINKDE